MPLIPADTTYTSIFDEAVNYTELVRHQGANQAYFRVHHTCLGKVCLRKKTGGAGVVRDLNMLPATEKAIFLDNAILACAKKNKINDQT